MAKLARALRLPEDALLNVAGFASAMQQQEAAARLETLIGSLEPVAVSLPVVDPEDPDLPPVERSTQLLRERLEGFVVRLSAPQNAPYTGEIVASLRPPKDGQGVVVQRSGRLSAWTYHSDAAGTWLERDGEKISPSEGEIRGSIIRVVQDLT